MHTKNIVTGGVEINKATKVLVLFHGRGGSAQDILGLANYFDVKGFALVAPQAVNNTWYPYSFLAPSSNNEPWLSSALQVAKEVVDDIVKQGMAAENIYFAGFSQGACIMLEFVTRNATRYGGVIAFTGGLIGDKINPANYNGNFAGTPVFIGTSNPDMHVPVERVYATSNILRDMGAAVTEKVYAGMGHTINEDEINYAKNILAGITEKAEV